MKISSWPGSPWRGLKTMALVALALALALSGCVALDEQQRKWIFQPSKQAWWGGAQAAEGMQERWITFRPVAAQGGNTEVKLHALWLAQERADAPVLLYLHGARWDVRSSAQRIRRMHELGFSVLAIDYRGFGSSSDQLPSEASVYEDARAAWDWIASNLPQAKRYIFGHSLGAAIAVHLAAEVSDESGLMVEGGFTSIADVVGSYRWGWLPLAPLITQRFDAAARVDRVGAPLLVVHGSDDQIIQPQLGRALFERAREPKRFVLVDGGSHRNTNAVGQVAYREAVRDLFGLDGGPSARNP